MGNEDLLKTPLYDEHVRGGGKIVPFAGWLLPVQYEGVIAEHMAVRTACGLFDVSHMGEITCCGKDALANLNRLLTNDYTNLADGHARYSPMCNEQGGVVDDLIVYKVADDDYFIVVNAANKDKDFAWMTAHAEGRVVFEDVSKDIAQIALQGPAAEKILRKLVVEEDIPKKYYTCNFHRYVDRVDALISRTGYTGEDGFELYLPTAGAEQIWKLLLKVGKEEGLVPCGLGARDTLRLEAAMPLYGHEMDDAISPIEAGLGMFVKMDKPDFIGHAALLAKGAPSRRRTGLRVTGRGIVREHQTVYAGDTAVGHTTSGTYCPYLKGSAAMALIDLPCTEAGTSLSVDVRGRRVEVEVVKLPFYKRAKS